MAYELHIGPYRGRDPLLYRVRDGVIANGMELYEASKIPIRHDRRLPRRPRGLRPRGELASARSARSTGDDADAEAFALFADNVRISCLAADDAPLVTAALEAFAFARRARQRGARGDRSSRALAERLLAAADHLLRGPVANRALIDECRPWIEAFELGARRAAAHRRPWPLPGASSGTPARELLPYPRASCATRRVRVFGDALDMTLADLTDVHRRTGPKARHRRRRVRMSTSWKTLAAIDAAAITALAGCAGSSAVSPAASPAASVAATTGAASAPAARRDAQASNDHVLRVAMGSPGEAQIRVWDDVAEQFRPPIPRPRSR